ncbi:RES domain-containing protein [Yoonia maricola]|uniref:RES domain-containing protein n=1 Tax=Yoonia maricola TaxID=420999 RepID=A0A2M8WPG4_9RHOB|nr:RES family NAD+ phosphorylase [Yoonia maricola]PJI92825.1 RES domain-containing protein [Yoonia maricola]
MFKTLNTTLYRIVFEAFADKVLDGVIHSEGRFHHDGQSALYASPSPETAAMAIDIYLKQDDAPRVMVPLSLSDARMVDLRSTQTCHALGVDPAWPSVPWASERAAGAPATSWRASDVARAYGADGMIYSSRRAPERWHVVLFRWNKGDGATLALGGAHAGWEPRSPV